MGLRARPRNVTAGSVHTKRCKAADEIGVLIAADT
jgi:hypothetical protein